MDIDFFCLNANDLLAENQFWGHLPLFSELHRSRPGLIISLTSPFLCSNYKGEKDDCKAIRAAIIFVKTFPTIFLPLPFPTICSLSCLAILCVLFSVLYFSIPLLFLSLFPTPFSHAPNVSLHFGGIFINVCALKWEEPGICWLFKWK